MQKKEEASNHKAKKTHRLGKKQKQQIKKKTETQKKAEGTNQEKKEQIRKRNANKLTPLKTISLATIEVASSVWAYLENVASYKLEILKTYK